MAKLPKTVKLGHLTYELHKSAEPLFHEGSPVWGLYQAGKLKITLSENIPPGANEAEVWLHECMHGLFDYFELNQMEGMTGPREEMIISTLSKGIIALLKDNPKFTNYLLEIINEEK